MEKNIDYINLYKIQDEVLELVFSLDTPFYLTGGTALHRFYYNLRYSDDLDFFTNNENFNEYIDQILFKLKEKEIPFSHPVKAKDFGRILVKDSLQIDFVNDRVFREGVSNIVDGFKIDNKRNIFANKISALLGRDEEKDIFDIFSIINNEDFNWGEILEIANKKTPVDKDLLIYRIDSFPLLWLNKIKIINPLDITKKHIKILVNDLLNERSNSFVKNK
ncbi:MAG: nucleotidyl transferase AbiEii/AbiGii toxin family protein [Deltaproteobacteria bacterium]|nr:nucleotidyl transferase AbiEii/AbiGii toxin family protein [Deltaproteobacteria bacterium]